jgi:hypothetical protein
MNRTSVFLYLIFALFSCSNVRRTYYPTGELKEEYVRIDDSTEKYTKYYKNGQKYIESQFVDSLFSGKSKIWWSDGELAWSGFYDKGHMTYEFTRNLKVDSVSWISIYPHEDTLKVGKKYKMRTFIQGIRYDGYEISVENAIAEYIKDDQDPYQYYLTPQKKGEVFVDLCVPNVEDGSVIPFKFIAK